MMQKRLVAMFIALIMVLTLLPTSSNAQKNAEPMQESVENISITPIAGLILHGWINNGPLLAVLLKPLPNG